MKIGSLVKLREDLHQKSEHLYEDNSCWNGNESISHWNGIRCGDVGLAVELTSTTCRLVQIGRAHV